MKYKNPSNIRPIRHAGFSLMELMIVVVIIVVLVGIGIPVAKNMRANAQRNQCINQLRTWAVAIGGYAADNDGRVAWRNWAPIGWDEARCSPYVSYWTAASVNFIDREDNGAFAVQTQMRHCPAVPYDKNDTSSNPSPTYAMIRPTGGTQIVTTDDYPLASITKPSRFIMMIEALENTGTPISSGGEFATKVKPLTVSGPNLRHNRTVNSLFADYSVKPMTWKEVERGTSYWTIF